MCVCLCVCVCVCVFEPSKPGGKRRMSVGYKVRGPQPAHVPTASNS